MTMLYPIVLETEENGAVSAYVPGLPVYAAADTLAKAEQAIRAVLAAYLEAHPLGVRFNELQAYFGTERSVLESILNGLVRGSQAVVDAARGLYRPGTGVAPATR